MKNFGRIEEKEEEIIKGKNRLEKKEKEYINKKVIFIFQLLKIISDPCNCDEEKNKKDERINSSSSELTNIHIQKQRIKTKKERKKYERDRNDDLWRDIMISLKSMIIVGHK